MSFVYAEKGSYKFGKNKRPYTNIYSDTKVSLTGAVKKNWSEQARKQIEKYGMVKSLILAPNICISFAGNDISYASRLANGFDKNENFQVEIEAVIDIAKRLHDEANRNKTVIEFIITYAKKNGETEIICIKESRVERNLPFAWIGSTETHNIMQGIRNDENFESKHDDSFDIFKRAVEQTKDETVGGFIIKVHYSLEKKSYIYSERLETYYLREQHLKCGESITLAGPAETGAYTVHFFELQKDVCLEFLQMEKKILYTKKHRYTEEDAKNELIRNFLLPIVV